VANKAARATITLGRPPHFKISSSSSTASLSSIRGDDGFFFFTYCSLRKKNRVSSLPLEMSVALDSDVSVAENIE
jgi:hypothetical protein